MISQIGVIKVIGEFFHTIEFIINVINKLSINANIWDLQQNNDNATNTPSNKGCEAKINNLVEHQNIIAKIQMGKSSCKLEDNTALMPQTSKVQKSFLKQWCLWHAHLCLNIFEKFRLHHVPLEIQINSIDNITNQSLFCFHNFIWNI